MDISIIILTLNGEKYIESILNRINSNRFKIIIIDSSSTDSTVAICKQFACVIKVVPRADFNHGATREFARNITKSKIVIFFTQDALPVNANIIEELIKPIIEGKSHVSYASQIPREDASIIESFPRNYNYGKDLQIRSIADLEKYGVYTFFCSNSCAAWSNKALNDIGGFKPTLTNEDYFACAELLQKGYKVAYVPTAIVTHSHKYSLKEEFQRMYDTGYVRAERPWIQELVGSANKRGSIYFQKLIVKLWTETPLLIPYAIIQTATKLLGYKIGFMSLKFPKYFKKFFSGQKYYWDSKYYEG